VDDTTFTVSGMSCSHCEATIKSALEQVAGVQRVEVALATKEVRIKGESLDESSLREAIRQAGYEAA
jgi:copper chaperone